MRSICILITLLCFCCCNHQKVMSEDEYLEYAKEFGWDKPDSLKTPQQLEMTQKLLEIGIMNTKVKKNRMYLTIDRDYFVEQGLPGICYDLVQFQYHNHNKIIKEIEKTEIGKMIDISEALEAARKDYSDSINR